MKRVSVAALAATVLLGCSSVERAGAQEPSASATAFLERVRGADPVVCDLVGQALRNRWGRGSVSPVVHVPGRSAETEAMVLWVMRRFEGDMVPALRAALDDADQCVRETAARLFDHTGNRTRAVQALSDAIRSSNLNTQLAAVMAMGYVEDRTLVPLLTERMTHRDPAMRQTVAWALGQLEHPDAVPVLARALGDRDVRVRANAAYALGRIERRAAVDPLADALRDADASVRINAAWALGQIEDEAAIPALADLLQRDQNAEVRRAAAWALGKIE